MKPRRRRIRPSRPVRAALAWTSVATRLRGLGISARTQMLAGRRVLVTDAAPLAAAQAGRGLRLRGPMRSRARLSGALLLLSSRTTARTVLRDARAQDVALAAVPSAVPTPAEWTDTGLRLELRLDGDTLRLRVLRAAAVLAPTGLKIGEPPGHLTKRAEWFARRHRARARER